MPVSVPQAIHAAISGALVIQGVPPFDPDDSVGTAFQDTAWNAGDGGYDLLEEEYREVCGWHRRYEIPVSPSAPDSLATIPDFTNYVGVGDLDLEPWWENEEAISFDGETIEAALAAHFFRTTEASTSR